MSDFSSLRDTPELIDPARLYEIKGLSRKLLISNIEHGFTPEPVIVFYGGERSAMTRRRHIGTLRYICGTKLYVFCRLREMKFPSWMDYRMYRMSVNQDFTYGKIGAPLILPADVLAKIVSSVTLRDKKAQIRQKWKFANENSEDKAVVRLRALFKKKLDATVKNALKTFHRDCE